LVIALACAARSALSLLIAAAGVLGKLNRMRMCKLRLGWQSSKQQGRYGWDDETFHDVLPTYVCNQTFQKLYALREQQAN
jgi:hypothetical protein